MNSHSLLSFYQSLMLGYSKCSMMLPPWCDFNSKPFHCLKVVGNNSQNAKWLSSLQKRLVLAEQRCMKHIIAHHLVFSQRHLHVSTYTHVTCAYKYRYYQYIIHTGFLCRKKQLKWKLSEEEVEVDEAMVFHGSDPWLGFGRFSSAPLRGDPMVRNIV